MCMKRNLMYVLLYLSNQLSFLLRLQSYKHIRQHTN